MTKTEESTTIEICIDCLIWHANGDLPDDPYRGAEVLSQVGVVDGHVTLGIMADEHSAGCGYEDNGECECAQVTFSSSRCDACHSTLGGARERVTLWYIP